MHEHYYPLPGGPVLILGRDTPFPPLQQALTDPNGLIAIGGDLQPERLIAAYKQGIFPWFSPKEPILWWSPDPRMVLFPESLNINRSLRKVIQQRPFDIRFNTDFKQVM